jgi:hypothetical protein
MMHYLQRRVTGEPICLGLMWTVTRRRRTAICELWTHSVGWELRLRSGATVLQSLVCRADDEMFDAHEEWRATMLAKGRRWARH